MDDTITLMNFFSPDFDALPARIAAGIDRTSELASLKSLLLRKLSGARRDTFLHTAAYKVRDLLGTTLWSIVERSWKDLREVREAFETTRASPGRTEVVALTDHTIGSEHRPHLDFYEGGQRIGQITFPVSLELELRGPLLEISEGAIRKIVSGELRVKGTLKIGDHTLVEKAFELVQLPGASPVDPAPQSSTEVIVQAERVK